MRTRVSIANQREFYDLKVAVRRAWAMRSVKASAANVFLGDSLKSAPYCAALAHRLRDVFRAVSSGLLPPVIPLETQMWSDGMAVTPASVGVATTDSNALADDIVVHSFSIECVDEKPAATTIRGLLQRIAVSEEIKDGEVAAVVDEDDEERKKKAIGAGSDTKSIILNFVRESRPNHHFGRNRIPGCTDPASIGAINIRDRIRSAYNASSSSSATSSSDTISQATPSSTSFTSSTSNFDASKYTDIFVQSNSRDPATVASSSDKEKSPSSYAIKSGSLNLSGDSVLLRSSVSDKRSLATYDTDIEVGGKIPTRTIAQVQAEVKREREQAKQAAEAALAAEKERIRRARLAARMQEAADVVAKERAEQIVEATRQRAVKLLSGETPSTAPRNYTSRVGNVAPSPYQSWLAAEKSAKNVLLESHDVEAIEAAVNRAREKANLAEQSGADLLTAPSSRATSPSGRLSDVHFSRSHNIPKIQF